MRLAPFAKGGVSRTHRQVIQLRKSWDLQFIRANVILPGVEYLGNSGLAMTGRFANLASPFAAMNVIAHLVACPCTFDSRKNPLADARGYNPARQGGDS